MFIDASAIVAILAGEPDGPALAGRIEAAPRAASSTVALFEAALALARTAGLDGALLAVESFVELGGIEVLDIRGDLLPGLVSAHRRYGKGSGHPARLNMGDCVSYAMARDAGLPLLYRGDDFARTDLADR